MDQMCCVPWGHHKLIIDKLMGLPERAFFYVQQTLKYNWSRSQGKRTKIRGN